jgi:hypothetical protein
MPAEARRLVPSRSGAGREKTAIHTEGAGGPGCQWAGVSVGWDVRPAGMSGRPGQVLVD